MKMGRLKHLALLVGGLWGETLLSVALWIGILAALGLLYFRISLFPLALATNAAIWFAALYWRALNESQHLTYFIGYLLLLDDTRAIQKQSFEDWLCQSDAKDPGTLSIAAMWAIQRLADRLAAGDSKKAATSSVFGFRSLIWNRKLGKA